MLGAHSHFVGQISQPTPADQESRSYQEGWELEIPSQTTLKTLQGWVFPSVLSLPTTVQEAEDCVGFPPQSSLWAFGSEDWETTTREGKPQHCFSAEKEKVFKGRPLTLLTEPRPEVS